MPSIGEVVGPQKCIHCSRNWYVYFRKVWYYLWRLNTGIMWPSNSTQQKNVPETCVWMFTASPLTRVPHQPWKWKWDELLRPPTSGSFTYYGSLSEWLSCSAESITTTPSAQLHAPLTQTVSSGWDAKAGPLLQDKGCPWPNFGWRTPHWPCLNFIRTALWS